MTTIPNRLALPTSLVNCAIKPDSILDVIPSNLPRVFRIQPRIDSLDLGEVLIQELTEDTVLVPKAVAPHGDVESGGGVEVAGGETAETTVACEGEKRKEKKEQGKKQQQQRVKEDRLRVSYSISSA